MLKVKSFQKAAYFPYTLQESNKFSYTLQDVQILSPEENKICIWCKMPPGQEQISTFLKMFSGFSLKFCTVANLVFTSIYFSASSWDPTSLDISSLWAFL